MVWTLHRCQVLLAVLLHKIFSTKHGKTLAFVLPILESLTNGPAKASRKTGYGRAPSVLVLLPTRELATQVFADFEVYGGALGLNSCCLYGGSPYQPQQIQLKRGVDIVVGTPGRIKVWITLRGNLDFRSLKFRVLDEADEMLRMGFVEDVELILGKVEDASKVQTLLFSATLPDWVKHVWFCFTQSIFYFSTPECRTQLIPDIIRCYSSGGRTIIFTETKDSASTLAGVLPGARALHGDIQQATREVTLSGFRSGKFSTLVATNVAARGLDIDDVQLIIQCEPPRDVEAYIHRSGKNRESWKSNFSKIERESGVKFEHISAPQPADIAKAAGAEAAGKINEISDSVIPVFKAAAQELLDSSELSPADLLAKALAKAAGYTEIKSRSLLTSMENYVTVLLECGKPIFSPSFAYGVLRRFLPEDKVESIKGLALTADGKGAVFDVAAQDLDTFLAGQENAAGVSLEVVKSLPRLQEREQSRGRFGGGGGGGGRGGFSDRRFSGGRGGGRGGFFKGPGGGRGRGNNNRKW
ncbi:DEAD-box ATP-dependent RNA helicase 7 [Sesamum angolense]|uniref:DEAD-box ATP-dependent RNA helicase 7 n=1 Tax=Sesamum angolense TaxID=2727404 RepID=A0AAE2BZJ8_9LAMI|nr:DEAD-box ATP-dependent RNA helicase 7 [Sesamum angolense]